MSLRDRYPLSYCFQDGQAELQPAFERIKGIWPFIIDRVTKYQCTLTPRQRANYDHEDIVSDIVLALLWRDKWFDPNKGRYITFAATVVAHELYAIRDRSWTVHAPANASARVKEYAQEEANGTLTGRRRRTAEAIQRARAVMLPIGLPQFDDSESDFEYASPSPDTCPLEDEELAALDQSFFRQAIRVLDLQESRFVGYRFGLWGQEQRNLWWISTALGLSVACLRKKQVEVIAKLRAFALANPKLLKHHDWLADALMSA